MNPPPGQADPDGFHIQTTRSPAGWTVTVCGDVDTATAHRLGACLDDALRRPGSTVELDLGDVTFLDSAGLTVLVGAHRRAAGAGVALRVRCGTSRAVRRPLQITGLLDVFTVVDPQPAG